MAWRKSPQALVELFDRAVPRSTGVERRRMFGYPAVFLNGHLFAGLHQEDFILRLPEPARERARVDHGARPFEPMPGRQMREYVVLPEAWLHDRATLAGWLARSMRYVRSLPPKRLLAARARRSTRTTHSSR
jgi:TfoX/Sxy family transcriptional regulator of competence genes